MLLRKNFFSKKVFCLQIKNVQSVSPVDYFKNFEESLRKTNLESVKLSAIPDASIIFK